VDRTIRTEPIVFWFCVSAFAVAGLAPIAVMLVESLRANGTFTLDHYRNLTSSARFWPLLWNSVRLAATTAGICGLIGVPAGILLAKTNLPLKTAFLGVLTAPFVLPPYFIALAWVRLAARFGLGISEWLFGFSGCVLVLATVFLPISILLTFTASSSVDRRLEEAALMVRGWPGVIRQITFPLSAPGIVFSVVLVFLLVIGELSVPNFLRYPVLPVLSFTEFAASYNFGAATAAAVPLAVIALLGIVVEFMLLRHRHYTFRGMGTGLIIPLGRWKSPWVVLMCLICFIGVVLPLGTLFANAFSQSAMFQAVTLAGDSLLRSVWYSAVAATALMTLGFLLAQFMRGDKRPLLNAATLLLFAIPGTVLSIGLIRLWNTPATAFIYASPLLLILGYTAQYCAVTTRLSLSGLMLIPPSFEEAACLSGASWAQRLFRISGPLSIRTLICTWLAGYILCVRDVPIALMTAPPGSDPLPARILTLMANGSAPVIDAMCLIMSAASLIPLAILARLIPSQDIQP
jgi:iron(III) transport system permease protein